LKAEKMFAESNEVENKGTPHRKGGGKNECTHHNVQAFFDVPKLWSCGKKLRSGGREVLLL
jgi:hypothetical protein